ncbi:hypothetical protein CVT25_001305 [Psilocybe cyanescens]|uniref:Uncharacterized protein n=1 Tax=Psilocybe cyanescens TaxID=93625 RepID=A0A409XEN1_PSICY|nr:hypothetical protein CVT25_001305 [Psilocybe cyanescens]
MQSFGIQKASASAIRTLRKDIMRISSCTRLTQATVSKSSSPRHIHISTHSSKSTSLPHIKSKVRIHHHHRTCRAYTTISPSPLPSQEQTPDVVFPDPNRPDLFYHFTPPPTPLSPTLPAFALSFLDVAPPGGMDSPAVIGWLPAQTQAPEGKAGSESESTLDDFVGNDKFLVFLHDTIKSALERRQDEIWRDAAIGLGSGWMHIGDQRNIPALGRVGDPDDILATVLVQDGQIVPGTYQPMPSYRICTVDGVLQLTPGLASHLKEALAKLGQDAQNTN